MLAASALLLSHGIEASAGGIHAAIEAPPAAHQPVRAKAKCARCVIGEGCTHNQGGLDLGLHALASVLGALRYFRHDPIDNACQRQGALRQELVELPEDRRPCLLVPEVARGRRRPHSLGWRNEILHRLADHADCGLVAAGEGAEELLHRLVAQPGDVLRRAVRLVDALDGRGSRDPEEVWEPLRIRRIARIPILGSRLEVGSDAPHEQRDIGAQAAAICVDFVEDEELAAVVGEDALAVRRANQQVLQHHVVREQDVRRVVAEALAVLLGSGTIVAGHLDVGVPGVGEVVADPRFLVVGQGVHRVDEDRREAVLLERRGVADGVLDDGNEEALRLARARAGRDHGVGRL